MFRCKIGIHKYKELGIQTSDMFYGDVPLTRSIKKCSICGHIHYTYFNVLSNDFFRDHDFMCNWTPNINLKDTISEKRKKKLDKLKKYDKK